MMPIAPRSRIRLIVYFYILFIPLQLWAGGKAIEKEYISSKDYISSIFGTDTIKNSIKPRILWITKDIRPNVVKILRRPNFPLRYRYYKRGQRTVWILNEIGKVMPITTAITIDNNIIIDLTVLTYRESHGSEIRFPAYTNQFNNIRLTEKMGLSKSINGISGATLSTNAIKKVGRLALYLHSIVMEKNVAKTK